MKAKTKEKRGGKRANSGRKRKDTATIYLKHDTSIVEPLKLKYGAKGLNDKIREFLNQL